MLICMMIHKGFYFDWIILNKKVNDSAAFRYPFTTFFVHCWT